MKLIVSFGLQVEVNELFEVEENGKSRDEKIKYLSEIYTTKSEQDLGVALKAASGQLEGAVHLVLEKDEYPSLSGAHSNVMNDISSNEASENQDLMIPGPTSSIVDILQCHTDKKLDLDNDQKLEVKREELWKGCLGFYKLAIHDTDRLKRNLFIEFTESGENGIDGGTLKLEFFSMCLDEAKLRLFEGDDYKLIPRRGIGSKGIQFEVMGAIIAHSILHGGPGFPYLAEWVVDYLIEGEDSLARSVISKDFIAKSPLTKTLLDLIERLDNVIDKEGLDEILEKSPQTEEYW